MEESWGDIQAWLQEVFAWAGLDAIEAEELAVLPGLDEVFALADIKTHADSGDWDVIVVDCAPTAETIRLLSPARRAVAGTWSGSSRSGDG